jgi:general nucleoside transport system permease protein
VSTVTASEATVQGATPLAPRSWRTPILLAVAALLTFVLFGVLGRDEATSFVWGSGLEPTSASPRILGLVLGAIALVAAGLAFWMAYGAVRCASGRAWSWASLSSCA